jgi:hypothetical protein
MVVSNTSSSQYELVTAPYIKQISSWRSFVNAAMYYVDCPFYYGDCLFFRKEGAVPGLLLLLARVLPPTLLPVPGRGAAAIGEMSAALTSNSRSCGSP